MIKCLSSVLLTALLTVFLSTLVQAQSLSNLSFGTDSTFEVVSWNIEWFPKNGQTSVNAVGEIIGALDIDVWALQEIDDSSKLKQAIANLNDYKLVYGGSDSRGLTYVYNTKTISNVKTYQLFSENKYSSPLPRAPLVLEFTYQDSVIRIINNHYKCCGNGTWDKTNTSDEENRRYLGHRLIMDYVDSLWSDENVILVGDLNDILTDDRNNNIFQNELTNSRQYRFVDLAIEESNNANWSYPSWPSHLDHILINGPLLKQYNKPTTEVRCIKVEGELSGGWSEYDRNISDHRPVAYKFDFNPTIEPNDTLETQVAALKLDKLKIKIYPNPTSGRVFYDLSAKLKVTHILVKDILGAVIISEQLFSNGISMQGFVDLDKTGIYFMQFFHKNSVVHSELIVKGDN